MREKVKLRNLVCLFICLFCMHNAVFAGSSKTKSMLSLIAKEHQVLVNAQKEISANNHVQAIDLLKAFQKRKISKLAKALTWKMLGAAYQAQLDYPNALHAYEKALAYKKLPKVMRVKLFEKTHKLNYFVKDWKKSTYWWLKWEKKTKPKAQDYLLVSTAYQYQKRWAPAKKNLLKAFALTQKPPQAWYRLMLLFDKELNQPKAQLKWLKKVLEDYPKDEKSWIELALFYQEKKQLKEQASILYSGFLIGAVKQKKYIYWLADSLVKQQNYMLSVNVLLEAKQQKLLEDDSKTLLYITQILMKAKAYSEALKVMNAQSSAQWEVERAEKTVLLGKIYFSLQRWQKTYTSLTSLGSHQRINAKDVQLLLGISASHLGKTDIAKIYFKQVLAIEPQNKSAKQWLKRS